MSEQGSAPTPNDVRRWYEMRRRLVVTGDNEANADKADKAEANPTEDNNDIGQTGGEHHQAEDNSEIFSEDPSHESQTGPYSRIGDAIHSATLKTSNRPAPHTQKGDGDMVLHGATATVTIPRKSSTDLVLMPNEIAETTMTVEQPLLIEPAPAPEPREAEAKKLVFAVSGLAEGVEAAAAAEVGQKEYDEMMARPGGKLRRFARGIIKGNIGREFLRYSKRQAAANRIAETGRLHDMNKTDWGRVTAESIQRVIDDEGTGEFMNRHEETREQLDSQKGGQIKSTVNGLIAEYVNGTLDSTNLQEEARRRFADLAKQDAETARLLGAGNVYMSNILDIAESVKGQITHEVGLQDVLNQVEYVSARVNTDVNTEAKVNRIQQFLDKNPLNLPAVATGALAIAYGAGLFAAKSAIGKATRLGVVSGGSAAIAYFQEKARLVHERAQVGREVAAGESVNGTERREKLAETLYDMKDASVMLEAMRSLRDDEGEYSLTSQADFDKLFAAAVDTTSRYDLSASEQADFIRFDAGRENIPAQRRAFLAERFKAKAALRHHFDTRRATDPTYANGVDFDTFYNNAAEGMKDALMVNVSDKDAEYKKLSRHYAWKRARQTLVAGVVLGTAMQEVVSIVSDNQQGVVEGAMGWNDDAAHDTVLETGREWGAQLFHHNADTLPQGTDALTFGGNTVNIDKSLVFTLTSGGTLAHITGPNGIAMDVPVNPNGTLTPLAIDRLHAEGIAYSDHVTSVPGETTFTDHKVSVKTFMGEHGTKVHRQWFDNDTPAPKFDLNELRLDLKTDEHGNVVYDGGRMLKGGSFHDGRVAGMGTRHIRLLVSPTESNQGEPFVFKVNEHGEAIIPKNSPVAQLFGMRDGQPYFKGAYAEWAQVDGRGPNGSLNVTMLATHVGEKEPITHFVDRVPEKGSSNVHNIRLAFVGKIPEDLGPAHDAGDVRVDFVPVYGRGGLRRNNGQEQSNAEPEPPEQSQEREPKPKPNTQSGTDRLPASPNSQLANSSLASEVPSDAASEAEPQPLAGNENDTQRRADRTRFATRARERARNTYADIRKKARMRAEDRRRERQEARDEAERQRAKHAEQRARFDERRRQAQQQAEQERADNDEEAARQRQQAEEANERQQQKQREEADRQAREAAERAAAREEAERQAAEQAAQRAREQEAAERRRAAQQQASDSATTQQQTPVQEAQNGDAYREAMRKHNAAVRNRDYWKGRVRQYEKDGVNSGDLYEQARVRLEASTEEVRALRKLLNRLMHEQQTTSAERQAA